MISCGWKVEPPRGSMVGGSRPNSPGELEVGDYAGTGGPFLQMSVFVESNEVQLLGTGGGCHQMDLIQLLNRVSECH